jgi:TorA maturation chaperone TorD
MSNKSSNAVKTGFPALRANVFHTLATAYLPPDKWPDEFTDAVSAAFLPFGGELASLAGDFIDLLKDQDSAPEKLAPAHARLFIGPFDIQAPPWASLYIDPEKRLMGDASRYAAQAYAEAGLGPLPGAKDAPDHVTHELEFMYFLAFQEHSSGEAVWRVRQVNFWAEHLGVWLPQFAALIGNATNEGSAYNFLSRLTIEVCYVMNVQFHIVKS